MSSIQMIQFTQHPRAWHTLAHGLGLREHGESNDSWTEFDGHGTLAVHGVTADDPLAGKTAVWVLVDDDAALDALEARLSDGGIPVTRGDMDDIGASLEIAVDAEARVHAAVGSARRPEGVVTIEPLIFTRDVEGASRVLTALGLQLRITSDSGGWAEFSAEGGGGIALHDLDSASNPVTDRVSLSFEHHGDLDAVAERLRASGVESAVIDEAYNRTLRAATPEGPELWVNGAATDLYGYTKHS